MDNPQSENIKLAVSKFKNINGVTCYMNSILAILQQTPILCDYIINGSFKETIIEKTSGDIGKINDLVIYQLYKLLKLGLSNDDFNITPISFRKAITKKDFIWGEQQHQDSQEFLNFIITNIEDEVSRKVMFIPGKDLNLVVRNPFSSIIANNNWEKFTRNEYSIIKTLFTGLCENSVICSRCNHVSKTFETFQLLSLSIPIKNKGEDLLKPFTLNDCLNYYFKKEKLDKDNKINCNFCYLKNQSVKKNKLWRTPKILIIHIKRFLMNDYGIPTTKLMNNITYPIHNLDLSDYISDESPFKDKSNYNLFGINVHHSLGMFNTINYGHYTSFVKNRFDNKWYHFDDSNPVREIKYEDELMNRNSYLLFYYRNN